MSIDILASGQCFRQLGFGFLAICGGLLFVACDENKEQETSHEIYQGMPISPTSLNEEVETFNAIIDIVKTTGHNPNFLMVPAYVDDVRAVHQNNIRYLAYNPEFTRKLYPLSEDRNWLAIAKISHEIGYHLSLHEWQDRGHSEKEILDADKYTGYVLYCLGAKQQEVQSAITQLVLKGPNVHEPALNERLNAVMEGFYDAREIRDDQEESSPEETSYVSVIENKLTKVQEKKSPLPKLIKKKLFVYTCTFYNDSNQYVVDDKGQIFKIKEQDKLDWVGSKTPSTKPGFQWMITTPKIGYGVSENGRIWARDRMGDFEAIGQVTAYPTEEEEIEELN